MPEFNLGSALAEYAENNEIHVLEAGTYTVEIVSATKKEGGKGPTITIFAKLVGGPEAGKRVGLGTLSFSPNATWKTFPILFGMGITKEYMQQANSGADPVKDIAGALVGRVIDATVIVDQWQGDNRNKVDRAVIANGATPSAPAPQQAAAPAPPPQQAYEQTAPPAAQPPVAPQPPAAATHTPSF
jgi:hypothetical protein